MPSSSLNPETDVLGHADLSLRQGEFPSAPAPSGAGGRRARHGPLPDEFAFKLGQRGKDAEGQPACRRRRVNLRTLSGEDLEADAFTHLRTGAPCKDRIGPLNVILAEGLNLGLSKMAEASSTHDYLQLSRLSRWHVESEAIERALAILIEAQSRLPMARSASSDGQFFPTTRQGEAMNLVNARHGNEPGLKAYS